MLFITAAECSPANSMTKILKSSQHQQVNFAKFSKELTVDNGVEYNRNTVKQMHTLTSDFAYRTFENFM